VQAKFGAADVQGKSMAVWPSVEGRRGVLYLENCYATKGDKEKAAAVGAAMRAGQIGNPFIIASAVAAATDAFASGDHWDLFDGAIMVSVGHSVRNNSHTGDMYFWRSAM
jgi:hypothetical protein